MRVTIEGSSTTRSTYLGPGERATVERTPLVEKLIRAGYVNIVRLHDPEPAPDVSLSGGLAEGQSHDVPTRSASRAVWAAFLDAAGVDYPEDAKRAELIAAWDAVLDGRR